MIIGLKPLNLNNGKLFDYKKAKILTTLSRCTYFFRSSTNTNCIRAMYKESNILAFKLKETDNKLDLIIQLPSGFNCIHYYKGKITSQIKSTTNSHLTYHGASKKKKLSGEIHLIIDDNQIMKDRANALEAPLAYSDDLFAFPLPICRFELSTIIESILVKENIHNFFKISGDNCFFNTMDIYIARAGFMELLLNASSKAPEIAVSIFVYTNLEGFRTGKIIRRRGNYPQTIVLQIRNFELIIFNITESQNPFYLYNSLFYFHS
jgi:hypothetical protein